MKTQKEKRLAHALSMGIILDAEESGASIKKLLACASRALFLKRRYGQLKFRWDRIDRNPDGIGKGFLMEDFWSAEQNGETVYLGSEDYHLLEWAKTGLKASQCPA